MTAINVVCQRRHNIVQILTDAAAYNAQGVLVGVGTKVFVEPNWPGAIAGRGTAIAVPLLGAALSLHFSSFDAMIDGVEAVLEGMVEHYSIGKAELIIAGISAERGPEAYMLRTSDARPIGISLEDAIASGHWPAPFKLQKLDDMTCGPVPQEAAVRAAVEGGFKMFEADEDPAVVTEGLLWFAEMQRHSLYDDGICWVGGHVELVTVGADGINHRILRRWPDKIGELMRPGTPDWNPRSRPSTKLRVVT